MTWSEIVVKIPTITGWGWRNNGNGHKPQEYIYRHLPGGVTVYIWPIYNPLQKYWGEMGYKVVFADDQGKALHYHELSEQSVEDVETLNSIVMGLYALVVSREDLRCLKNDHPQKQMTWLITYATGSQQYWSGSREAWPYPEFIKVIPAFGASQNRIKDYRWIRIPNKYIKWFPTIEAMNQSRKSGTAPEFCNLNVRSALIDVENGKYSIKVGPLYKDHPQPPNGL